MPEEPKEQKVRSVNSKSSFNWNLVTIPIIATLLIVAFVVSLNKKRQMKAIKPVPVSERKVEVKTATNESTVSELLNTEDSSNNSLEYIKPQIDFEKIKEEGSGN